MLGESVVARWSLRVAGGMSIMPPPSAKSASEAKKAAKPAEDPLPTVPPWASLLPSETFHLQEMKEWKVINKYPLGSQQQYIIGRTEPADVILSHGSISRRHARIISGTENSPAGATLIDMESTHGCFLVGPDGKRTRIKSGASEVLKDGDILAFGQSTRTYTVAGLTRKRKDVVAEAPPKEKVNPYLGAPPETFPKKTKKAPPQAGQHGNWECKGCGNVNYPKRDFCNQCDEPRE